MRPVSSRRSEIKVQTTTPLSPTSTTQATPLQACLRHPHAPFDFACEQDTTQPYAHQALIKPNGRLAFPIVKEQYSAKVMTLHPQIHRFRAVQPTGTRPSEVGKNVHPICRLILESPIHATGRK